VEAVLRGELLVLLWCHDHEREQAPAGLDRQPDQAPDSVVHLPPILDPPVRPSPVGPAPAPIRYWTRRLGYGQKKLELGARPSGAQQIARRILAQRKVESKSGEWGEWTAAPRK
jgi:hypothetical protein